MKSLAVALVAALVSTAALAADPTRDYPVRPVRMINPFPPGGSSDPSCRLLADALTKSLGFDPKKDFAPVIKFGSVPNVLVVHPSLPARTLAEFTQYVKTRPDELNYASAGNLRALAVLASARSSVLPDVPTTREAGMPGLEAGTWYTVMAPAGTPKVIVAKLNKEINTALAEPAFRKRVMDMGPTIMGGAPEDVASYIASESIKWSDLVRSAGVKVD